MKIVVLDGFATNPGDLSWDFLSALGEAVVYDKLADSETAQAAQGAVAVFTNRARIDKAFLDAVPTLRFVSATGTGYDMIDVAECHRRGIVVCNVPAYSSDAVAQHAFTLLNALANDLNGLQGIVRDGKWTGMPGFHYETVRTTELAGQTVGLLGYGGIGRRMAEICHAFGMRVLATTRNLQSGSDAFATFVPLETLQRESDFLSIHCPLTAETRGMVDAAFLSKMKKGAMLINTARGAILNEAHVAEALHSGSIAGLGADVLATEPPPADHPFLTTPNTIITPHCAWTPRATRARLLSILEANLRSFIETGHGINEVKG